MLDFISLLKKSGKIWTGILIPLMLGTIVFVPLYLLVDGAHKQQSSRIIRESLLTIGISNDRYKALDERMRKGDEEAFTDFLTETQRATDAIDQMQETDREEFFRSQSVAIGLKLIPALFIFSLLGFIVFVLSKTYFLILALGLEKDALEAFWLSLIRLVQMLGVSLWVIIRSFIWIPVVGVIPAVILLPRLVFSCIIFLTQKKGVIKSVSESYEKTKGKWTVAFKNYLLLFVCIVLAVALLETVIDSSRALGHILMLIVWQGVVSFVVVFTVVLWRETINS
ncbi:MAG: hypothetical protein QF809_05055 [Candidatus Peribacteraceae bacterium]|jgi:hypothetical protein|nr:hypothetical protein [Candidatus Peribacteraceae bacterium]|tara:strand:+ start:481 stop:1326 length:846 start_codon:yes stop_codon:yes gene_type:complete